LAVPPLPLPAFGETIMTANNFAMKIGALEQRVALLERCARENPELLKETLPANLAALQRLLGELRLEAEVWQRQAHDSLKQTGELLEKLQAAPHELAQAHQEKAALQAERRDMTEALTRQSLMLDAFFEHSITPLALLDKEFNFIRVNKAYARDCAREVTEFSGRNHFELYPSEAQAIFEEVVATRKAYQTFARPFVFPDHPEWGVTYWDWSLTPILNNEGEVDFLVFSLNDVTDRVRAEETRTRLNEILEATPDFVGMADAQGQVLFINRAGRRMLGMKENEDLSGLRIADCHPRGVMETVLQQGLPAAMRDGVWQGETALLSRDGREIPLSQVILAHKDPQREFKFFSTIARDISEKKQAELALRQAHAELEVRVEERTRELAQAVEELRESEERYRRLVELSPNAILVHRQGRFVFANPAALELFGASAPEDLLGQPLMDRVHPDYQEMVRTRAKRALQGEKTELAEVKIVRLDGRAVDVEATGVGIAYQGEPAVLVAAQDITPRKEAEREIRRLATFPELNPNPVLEVDKEGRVLYANPGARQAAEKTGLPEGIRGFLPPDLKEMFAAALQGGPRQYSFDVTFKDAVYAATLYLPHDLPTARLYALDITQRQRAEEALARREAEFAAMFHSITDGIIFADTRRRIVMANPAACTLYGYSPEEMRGRTAEFLYADSQDYEEQGKRRYHTGDEADRGLFETRYRRKDGSVFPAESLGTQVRDNQGKVLGYVAIHRDISRRKAAEQALRGALAVSQQRQREIAALLEATQAILGPGDFNQVARAIYDRCKGFLGATAGYVSLCDEEGTRNEPLFLDSGDMSCNVDPALPMPMRGLRAEAYRRGKPVYSNDFLHSDYVAFLPPGHAPLNNVLFSPMMIQGRVVGMLGLANKEGVFTEHDARVAGGFGELAAVAYIKKEAEEAQERLIRELEAERAKLQAIIESAPMGILVADAQGHPLMANPAYEELFFRPSRDIPNCSQIFNYCFPDGAPCSYRERPLFRSYATGDTCRNVEMGALWPDGWRKDLLVNTAAIVSRDGQITGAVGVYQDITALKQAEREIRELNKELHEKIRELNERTAQLEEANQELEAFSYSVSHDLRAPLRAIEGFSRMFREEYEKLLDAEGHRILEIIRSNASYMGELIDDLLALSRLGRQELRLWDLDLEALAREVFQDFKRQEPGRRLELTVHSPLPGAWADRSLITQVLVNLLDNAIKFTRPREAGVIELGGWTEEDENVYYVKDNGVGFDIRYVDKIFGVFQRLHRLEDFEGTGVGLALVERVVKRHGGRVWATGQVDAGATIFFTLPRKGVSN